MQLPTSPLTYQIISVQFLHANMYVWSVLSGNPPETLIPSALHLHVIWCFLQKRSCGILHGCDVCFVSPPYLHWVSESGAVVAALAVVTVRGARAPAAAATVAAVTAVAVVAATAAAAGAAVAAGRAGRGRARPIVRDGTLPCAAEKMAERDHIIQTHNRIK